MQAQSPLSHRPVVLVIDDDPAVCSSLKFFLELEGFAVRTYPDAAAVLRAADVAGAACLVVDYKLPGINGLQLLQKLRTRGMVTPAILITSHPGAVLSQAAARAGISIVEKPLLGNALGESVRNACMAGEVGR